MASHQTESAVAAPTATPFTPAQQRAITTVGGGVLVSAAAGSGKTATLAERVAHLVCGDGLTPGCDVERILVLTFTRNAAAEMKTRIEKVLRRRAQELAGTTCAPHLAQQVLLLGRAQVTTIDSFCQKLVREHFHQLGIDPRFGILPPEDTAILQAQALRQVMDEVLEDHEGGKAGRDLIEWYGAGDEQRVMALIRSLSNLWGSLVDPEAWREQAMRRIEDAAENPRESALATEFEQAVAQRLAELRSECEGAMPLVEDFPGYQNYLRETLGAVLENWDAVANDRGVWELEPADLPNLPKVASGTEGKDAAKKVMDDVKDAFNAGPLPGGWGSANEAYWRKSMRSVVPRMRELIRLTVRFEQLYAELKASRRVMDFADVQREALRLLRDSQGQPTSIARELHERFEHVLIDECQDINELNDTMLSLVSRECIHRSNLFSVGDVKQSVYRFRLAEPQLFLAREKRYREHEVGRAGGGVLGGAGSVITLSENFRSRGPLLESINALFSKLMVDGRTEVNYLTGGHALKEGKPIPPATFPGSPLELHLLPTDATLTSDVNDVDQAPDDDEETDDLEAIEREAFVVARRMREMMGQLGGARATVYDKALSSVRPIRWSDMAVLMRVVKGKAKLFASVLRREGVPVYAEVRGGLLEAQEVRDVLSVLELLDNPGRDIALAAYLRSPLALLAEPDETMARARAAHPELPFHQALFAWAGDVTGEATDEYQAALGDALSRLRTWRELARRRSIADVLDAIFADTYYTTYVLGLSDGVQRQANLAELKLKARAYGAAGGAAAGGGGGGLDVGTFTDFLADLEDSGGGEPDQPALSVGGDFVTLQSIHKSKGLEYSVVFVPDLGTRFSTRELSSAVLADRQTFLSPKAVDEEKNGLYPSPAWLLARRRKLGPMLAEELRVLYVALTRAREHLVLVGSLKGAGEDAMDRSRQRWGRAAGPSTGLPEASIMGMKTPLEWIMAAASAAEAQCPQVLQVKEYSKEEVARWAVGSGAGAEAVPDWARRLESPPGDNKQPPSPEAQEVIQRLSWRYPHDSSASRAGSVSVSSLTKGASTKASSAETDDERPPTDHLPWEPPDSPPDSPPGSQPGLSEFLTRLQVPNSLANVTIEVKPSLSATDRGTATHLVLEHLDFSHQWTKESLELFLSTLVTRGLLRAEEAAEVSVEGLLFVTQNSEIVPLLRGDLGTVYRELEIYLPLNADDPDGAKVEGMDRTMIRGRIDVLVDTPQGPIVIDYKTDHVWGERLADRVELYRGQVALYQEAARRITGRQAAGVYLVFIHPAAKTVVKVQ